MSRNQLLDENENEDEEQEASLHDRLKRIWRNERCAPTLLNYEAELVNEVRSVISEQEEEMESVREQDPDGTTLFMVSLLELEIDRFKFLLRSYLRFRLTKVQKFNQYLLSDPDRISLMSNDELKFCKDYTDMMQAHYNSCYLDKMPVPLRELNLPHLTTTPPVNNHVFVRVLEDIENVQVGDVDNVDLKRGEIAIVKYSHVDQLINTERLELV